MPSKRGFTLIELLVVIVIIGIMTGIALVAFGDFGARRKLRVSLESLVSYLKVVEEKAIIESAYYRVSLTSKGYKTYKYSKARGWQALPLASFLRERTFPKNLLSTEFKALDIIVSSTGELNPFEKTFGDKSNPLLFKLIGKHNGEIFLIEPKI